MNINYNEKMKEIIKNLNYTPNLLLHSCCGPCSTEVISRLTKYFNITVLYYNPNIEPKEEYIKRKKEQIRFLNEFSPKNDLIFMDCDYENEIFLSTVKGLENEPEGGHRCHMCYELRLEKTAQLAKAEGFDFFCTTLSVSPYKNAKILNEIGETLAIKYNVKYLYSDFKKENGYLNSINLAKKYDLYRQNYCGCHFSKDLQIDE